MRIKTFTAALILAAAATGAVAQTPGNGRAVAKQIAAELGLTRQDVAGCVRGLPRPETRQAPTDVEREAAKTQLIACLQQVNPEISEELIRATVEKYRPVQ